MVIEVPRHFQYPRDPNDEHVINLAITANVHYIVSRDNDLLDLMNKSRSESADFLLRYPDVTVLDPVAFLKVLTPTVL